jgi:hypothetical protein
LYSYSDSVWKADKSLRDIAADVSLTASVLSELGSLLQSDSSEKLVSVTALATADQTVSGCKQVFEEIDDSVVKLLGEDGPQKGKGKESGMSVWNRMKWPLIEPKIRLLQSNLERLKSTLLLMLHVITYARTLSGEYVHKSGSLN